MKNVLKINSFAELKEEKSLIKYIKALNFQDLMIEADTALKELNNGPLTTEVSLRSKTIIKEFAERLKSEVSGDISSFLPNITPS